LENRANLSQRHLTGNQITKINPQVPHRSQSETLREPNSSFTDERRLMAAPAYFKSS
jgi:hypothetical protein